ncbi:TRAP transporter small permease subunit [Leptothrix discophora]|uniref:TRAP transporter small permease protein n=1 Tax=Leptothrix discophora TaxID=89 RepID=A0ABT9FZJ5_LEPDI|nr:TRAP transporter small permease subunit [Leptothrix discophora]MDP4299653.1 TRAP transporter small permease subunit [Leptothrix discophora]
MKALIGLAHRIDSLSDRFGTLASWAVLLSCVISGSNAVFRYVFSNSSNGWLEIQWYLFATCVMFGGAQVLRVNEHVRVDLFYGKLSGRGKVYVDLFGLLFFLMPVIGVLTYMTWQLFIAKLTSGMLPTDSMATLGSGAYLVKLFTSGEMSSNAGGLIRWPAILTLPLGFGLLMLQGVSEVIKRVGWLTHTYEMDTHYERPLQ